MKDEDLLKRFFASEQSDYFSADETQRLNTLLSKMTINDIPDKSIGDTESHLISVLNMGAVEPSIINKLEDLLINIQGN